MNNSTVPTSITDRNGKQTTVHKKPVAQPAATRSIPSIHRFELAETRDQSPKNQELSNVLFASKETYHQFRNTADGYASPEGLAAFVKMSARAEVANRLLDFMENRRRDGDTEEVVEDAVHRFVQAQLLVTRGSSDDSIYKILLDRETAEYYSQLDQNYTG